MLREAQTGTEGHVIGVDETCGGVLFRAGGLLQPISLPFQSSESEGACLFIRWFGELCNWDRKIVSHVSACVRM